MNTLAKREAIIIILIIVVFSLFLYPSLRYARRETRDGIRRQEIADTKHQLEMYFNKHNSYPLMFNASPHKYVVTSTSDDMATGWYLRAQMENNHQTGSDFDHDLGRQYFYRYLNEDKLTYYDVCGGQLDCNQSIIPLVQ